MMLSKDQCSALLVPCSVPPTGTVLHPEEICSCSSSLSAAPSVQEQAHQKCDVNLLARAITCRDGALAAGTQRLSSQMFLWDFVLFCLFQENQRN